MFFSFTRCLFVSVVSVIFVGVYCYFITINIHILAHLLCNIFALLRTFDGYLNKFTKKDSIMYETRETKEYQLETILLWMEEYSL